MTPFREHGAMRLPEGPRFGLSLAVRTRRVNQPEGGVPAASGVAVFGPGTYCKRGYVAHADLIRRSGVPFPFHRVDRVSVRPVDDRLRSPPLWADTQKPGRRIFLTTFLREMTSPSSRRSARFRRTRHLVGIVVEQTSFWSIRSRRLARSEGFRTSRAESPDRTISISRATRLILKLLFAASSSCSSSNSARSASLRASSPPSCLAT